MVLKYANRLLTQGRAYGKLGYMKTLEELLSERFKYDPITGILVNNQSGKPITVLDKHGYIVIRVVFEGKRKFLLGHRVAWLLQHGSWPVGEVDHINGVRSYNAANNLRVTTRHQNAANRTSHRAGRLPGTHKLATGKWRSRIRVNLKEIHLGFFDNEQDAHNAYMKYKADHNI